ncbi:HAMP domain-containing sensor histidine kinase [Methylomicrobium sp. Wu6]|uniref:sensor histidine kinase n=1 Tax=Methylomicrobium sp. Wu6 TaxID=3107928 RepID=UPI002DD67301|nr:HAMP domain-containing sensor histidine kinase [Methylomicrobium sp. Wu6]MEC4749414.1 HAMP domain-containing sensor histidine kinase [Methylomicrobium sp. Wu6]
MKQPSLVSTTSFKLSTLYLGLFLCSFLAIGITVYFLTHHTLEQQLKSNIDSEVNRLKAEYETGGSPELITEINELLDSNSQYSKKYGLVNQQGELVAGNFSDFKLAEGWQTLVAAESKNNNEEEHPELMAHVIVLPNRLWLGVGHDSEYIEETGEAIIQSFLWGVVLVIALGVASGFYISRTFLKKIAGITQSAQAIIAGDLSHRLAVSKNQDELDKLALLLNRMLDKIAALIENVQQVSNDIAHDLRTPVSRLKFRLEEALKANLSKTQYHERIASALAEVDTILDTFAALLRISQIESQSRRSGFKVVNLSDVVVSVADALIPVAEEQGKIIATDIEQRLEIYGDKDLLTQLVFNLLENAILHTPEHTRIAASLKSSGLNLELIIADNGPGISEAHRQRVFQRFYRLEQSRTTAGNGLGLSIVAAIVDLHQGSIAMADNRPGLKVLVDLNSIQNNEASDGSQATRR